MFAIDPGAVGYLRWVLVQRGETMTKSELIQNVADRLRLPASQSEMVVNTIFDSMTDALVTGARIEIRGFGAFEVRHYKAYEGRNPRTGQSVPVAPKRLPFFTVGKELKERGGGLRHHPPHPKLAGGPD